MSLKQKNHRHFGAFSPGADAQPLHADGQDDGAGDGGEPPRQPGLREAAEQGLRMGRCRGR